EEVSTARAALAAAERDRAVQLAKIRQAAAGATRAKAEEERSRRLFQNQAATEQEVQQRVAEARATQAELEAARHMARSAQKAIEQQQARLQSALARQKETASNAPRQIASSKAT